MGISWPRRPKVLNEVSLPLSRQGVGKRLLASGYQVGASSLMGIMAQVRVCEGLIQDSGVPTSPLPGGFLQEQLGGTHQWVPRYHSSHQLPAKWGCLGSLSFKPGD